MLVYVYSLARICIQNDHHILNMQGGEGNYQYVTGAGADLQGIIDRGI
jgi:hypothetical protein